MPKFPTYSSKAGSSLSQSFFCSNTLMLVVRLGFWKQEILFMFLKLNTTCWCLFWTAVKEVAFQLLLSVFFWPKRGRCTNRDRIGSKKMDVFPDRFFEKNPVIIAGIKGCFVLYKRLTTRQKQQIYCSCFGISLKQIQLCVECDVIWHDGCNLPLFFLVLC